MLWKCGKLSAIPKELTRLHIITLTMVVAIAAFFYLSANLQASDGKTPIMPLDDAYIHFQYARAFADGYPLRYNPDQLPTSGATSLLYPLGDDVRLMIDTFANGYSPE